jgi:hypothetical protein
MKKLTSLMTWAVIGAATVGAAESKLWIQYAKAKKSGSETILPNYTYAGYNLGKTGIPKAKGKIFDVTKFGARPNDGKSDFLAVQKAVKAAEANGGGIVLFPPGRFLFCEKNGYRKGIEIHGDNIILKGSGSGPEGTEIFMKNYMEPKDPKKMYSVPALFNFSLSKQRNRRPKLTTIIANAQRETFKVKVANTQKLKVGKYVILEMHNPAANQEFLAGMKTWPIWTTTNKKGVLVRGEKHRIVKIQGNTVTFAEPIHCNINASHGWKVLGAPFGKGWGVEDIHFRGNFKLKFKHHKDFIHDSGWTFVSMTRGLFPYVRRCRFTDCSSAAGMGACYGGTIINCSIEGNQGHCSFTSGYYSYGNLIAFTVDTIKNGAFHGIAASAGSVGTVIFNCKNSNRGFDWHGSWPYCTLIDDCSGGLIGNGGSYKVLPNHMRYLTFWNFKQTAGEVFRNYDFWAPRRGKGKYSGAKIVKPFIVGYHGKPTTFLAENCEIIESLGKPVSPKSLYEAQMKLRFGKLPEWIQESREQFNFFNKHGYFKTGK